jgi:hypothetical protein
MREGVDGGVESFELSKFPIKTDIYDLFDSRSGQWKHPPNCGNC